MESYFITRREHLDDSLYTEPSNHKTHFYPFSELPLLKSHLYPHFVVYDAGEKLATHTVPDSNKIPRLPGSLFDEAEQRLPGASTLLPFILRLYTSWTSLQQLSSISQNVTKATPDPRIDQAEQRALAVKP